MGKIVRTSLFALGAAVCGPVMAGPAVAAEMETQVRIGVAAERSSSYCLLCWPPH